MAAVTPDLEAVAAALGFPLRKQGGTLGCAVCPACGPGEPQSNRLCIFVGRDGRQRWRCFACSARGDAYDFIAHAEGIPLREAMQRGRALAGAASAGQGQPARVLRPERKSREQVDARRAEAVREVARRISATRASSGRVRGYLADRGIAHPVIDRAVERGILRVIPGDSPGKTSAWLREHVGEALMREAGMLKEGRSWPALAFRPLLFMLPRNSGIEARRIEPSDDPRNPKSIRYGEMASPWWWCESPTPASFMLVEGAIDMLALLTRGLDPGMALVGLPGAQNWRAEWFAKLKARWPHIQAFVGLDNDAPGDAASQAIAQALDALGITNTRVRPRGKDWCDDISPRRHGPRRAVPRT